MHGRPGGLMPWDQPHSYQRFAEDRCPFNFLCGEIKVSWHFFRDALENCKELAVSLFKMLNSLRAELLSSHHPGRQEHSVLSPQYAGNARL